MRQEKVLRQFVGGSLDGKTIEVWDERKDFYSNTLERYVLRGDKMELEGLHDD